MKKIFNKKSYFFIVILQVIILIIMKNTITDLYYTGFQNKGFNNKILDKISAKTYDKYALLMNLEDFDIFDKAYKYNKKTDVYTLKDKYDKKQLIEISRKILPMHYLFYEGLQNGYKEVLDLTEYHNIYNVLNGLSDDQKNKLLKDARKKIAEYSDKEINELVIKETQLEYKNLGENINNIKENYVKKTIIKLILETIFLIGLSIINILNRKYNNTSFRKQEIFQSIFLLTITFIYLYKIKIILTSILLIIYLIVLGCIKLLDKLRKQINSYNIELSKLEDLIDTNKHIEKNYKIKWIYLIIILNIINLIIYNKYTTYHIFTGVDAYSMQLQLLYWFALVLNIFVFRGLFFYILEILKENRPALKKEKIIQKQPSIKEKKKKKKKKKSKK